MRWPKLESDLLGRFSMGEEVENSEFGDGEAERIGAGEEDDSEFDGMIGMKNSNDAGELFETLFMRHDEGHVRDSRKRCLK